MESVRDGGKAGGGVELRAAEEQAGRGGKWEK